MIFRLRCGLCPWRVSAENKEALNAAVIQQIQADELSKDITDTNMNSEKGTCICVAFNILNVK